MPTSGPWKRTVAGVMRADANHELGRAIVSYEPATPPDRAALIAAVATVGCRATVE